MTVLDKIGLADPVDLNRWNAGKVGHLQLYPGPTLLVDIAAWQEATIEVGITAYRTDNGIQRDLFQMLVRAFHAAQFAARVFIGQEFIRATGQARHDVLQRCPPAGTSEVLHGRI